MASLMRTRYFLGFGLAALILAGVGISILFATQRYRQDSAWVAHTYDVLRRVEQVRSTLVEGIAAQRSYLLTGNAEYQSEYLRARPLVHREISGLVAIMRDNDEQDRRITHLGELIDSRLDSASKGIGIYNSNGLVAAQDYTRTNRGLAIMREIEALIEQISADESSLLKMRVDRSERSAMLLLSTGAIGIPVSLAILLWIYVLLSREVRDRGRAEAQAQQLNSDLHHSVGLLRRSTADLHQLGQYAGLLQSCRNVPEALDITRRTLATMFPETGGGVYLLRESEDHSELETSWGDQAAVPHTLMLPHECWGIRRSRPHAVAPMATGMACGHFDPPASGEASTLCIPLIAQGLNLGMMYLQHRKMGDVPHVEVATAAAEQLSLALNNLRLRERLRQQSIRDALTGLYNRRYLLESLPRELSRARRRDLPLALIMLDLDHFKAFNDLQGHDGGDALLAQFGTLLQSMCREEDIPCRYGGEEFTLILPDASEAATRQRAEDIRVAVEQMSVTHLQRRIGNVTVSIGVAMFPAHADTAETLQKRADSALYQAKHGGRNRIEVAPALVIQQD